MLLTPVSSFIKTTSVSRVTRSSGAEPNADSFIKNDRDRLSASNPPSLSQSMTPRQWGIGSDQKARQDKEMGRNKPDISSRLSRQRQNYNTAQHQALWNLSPYTVAEQNIRFRRSSETDSDDDNQGEPSKPPSSTPANTQERPIHTSSGNEIDPDTLTRDDLSDDDWDDFRTRDEYATWIMNQGKKLREEGRIISEEQFQSIIDEIINITEDIDINTPDELTMDEFRNCMMSVFRGSKTAQNIASFYYYNREQGNPFRLYTGTITLQTARLESLAPDANSDSEGAAADPENGEAAINPYPNDERLNPYWRSEVIHEIFGHLIAGALDPEEDAVNAYNQDGDIVEDRNIYPRAERLGPTEIINQSILSELGMSLPHERLTYSPPDTIAHSEAADEQETDAIRQAYNHRNGENAYSERSDLYWSWHRLSREAETVGHQRVNDEGEGEETVEDDHYEHRTTSVKRPPDSDDDSPPPRKITVLQPGGQTQSLSAASESSDTQLKETQQKADSLKENEALPGFIESLLSSDTSETPEKSLIDQSGDLWQSLSELHQTLSSGNNYIKLPGDLFIIAKTAASRQSINTPKSLEILDETYSPIGRINFATSSYEIKDEDGIWKQHEGLTYYSNSGGTAALSDYINQTNVLASEDPTAWRAAEKYWEDKGIDPSEFKIKVTYQPEPTEHDRFDTPYGAFSLNSETKYKAEEMDLSAYTIRANKYRKHQEPTISMWKNGIEISKEESDGKIISDNLAKNKLDLQSDQTTLQEKYYQDHSEKLKQYYQDTMYLAALSAHASGKLSSSDFSIVKQGLAQEYLKGIGTDLPPKIRVLLPEMYGVNSSSYDAINNPYQSNNLVIFEEISTGRRVLVSTKIQTPKESSDQQKPTIGAAAGFNNKEEMQRWLISNEETQQWFSNHFNDYYNQDGKSYYGVRTMLNILGESTDPSRGTYRFYTTMGEAELKSNKILVNELLERQKKAHTANADVEIPSNSEATTQRVLSWMRPALYIGAGVTAFIPGGQPVSVLLAASASSTHVYEALSADDPQERENSRNSAILSAILAPLGFGGRVASPGLAATRSFFQRGTRFVNQIQNKIVRTASTDIELTPLLLKAKVD